MKPTTPAGSTTPIADRPLSDLLYFGPEDPETDLFEALRGIKSLLHAMFASIDEETEKFRLSDQDLSELLSMVDNLVEKVITSADIWSAQKYEVIKELHNRANLMNISQ